MWKNKKEDLLNALDRIKLRRQDLSLAKNNTELELASSKAPVIDPDTIQKALERFREIMRSEPGDKQKSYFASSSVKSPFLLIEA